MHAKHGEDPSIHPKYDIKLWLDDGATDRSKIKIGFMISL
jgi:hypothetical protein